MFQFLLAVAAQRYGMQIHAFCVMSNHVHIVLTDPGARLPLFHQFLDSLVARALNHALGRRESFWNSEGYNATRLLAPEDIVDKAAYVLANPVEAGLVHSAGDWPGLWSDPLRFGESIEVQRPEAFFSANGDLPETASLELAIPSGFGSAAEYRERVCAALVEKQRDARERHATFVGVARVLKQSPYARPASVEPLRRLSPRIAARNTSMRIEALAQLKAFWCAYRAAWAARRAGKANVLFPAGTYLLRVAHGVQCAALG